MVGELVLGRFRIERRIGSGGFGTVYRAWDERLQRPVAVKVVEGDHRSPRVAREAQAVARLGHRNIATLYELASEDGHAYLVSELVEGEPLRVLAKRGALNDRLLASVGAGAAGALAHAHRGGVVHRDIKPENILVARDGVAKIVDFGIARISGAGSLTRTGAVLGTLAYMAPEQAEGLRPGPAADVYSLALTLYECFAGRHPLLRDGPAATARAIGEPVPPLSTSRPDLPETLTEAIDDCLDPDPELRPLASELESALAGHAAELAGDPLPAVAGLDLDEQTGREPILHSLASIPRLLPAAAIAVVSLAAILWAGGPAGPILLVPPLAGLLALARPRFALALAALATICWLAISADRPGAALLGAALASPLLLAPVDPRAALLPALAPLLGLLGAASAYPALAGLTRGAIGRAVLGAAGFAWLAVAEQLSGRTLLLGEDAAATNEWSRSAGTALGEVIIPLLDPANFAVAACWAAAAFVLPLMIRGGALILDLVGALVWVAGLASFTRLVAGPGAEPTGLLLAASVGALAAIFAAHRLRSAEGPAVAHTGADAHLAAHLERRPTAPGDPAQPARARAAAGTLI